MKKKILIFLCLFLFTQSISAAAEPLESSYTNNNTTTIENSLELSAESAILMDAATGEILYEKNSRQKEYPASITKLMTVLLALENDRLSDTVTFSEEAIFGIERNSSHIALDIGEQITMEQALYAIMLQSANEAALGVAEHIDGSIEAFADHMNRKAHELGCQNTNFVNPNGLHDDNHYTSAYDMALITKAVLKYPKFKEISATTYYEIPPTNIQPETRYLYAQHKMIKDNSSFYYPDCEGGKTGFTNQALNTLVSYAKRGDTELIAVVLRDAGTGIYTDTIKLFDYGFDNFETMQVFSVEDFSKNIDVTQQYKNDLKDVGTADLAAETDVFATLPKGSTLADIRQEVQCADFLTAPVAKGTSAGSITMYYNDQIIGQTNIIAENEIPETSVEVFQKQEMDALMDKLKTLAGYCSIAGAVLLLIMLAVRQANYRKQEKLRRKRYRERYRSDRY